MGSMNNNEVRGCISYIQEMSVHDGEGLRTTVFFKGCDLRCKWCHNPETFIIKQQLEWISSKCISCGKCLDICPNSALSIDENRIKRNLSLCIQCLKCVGVCCTGAHNLVGNWYTVDELFSKIVKDNIVYNFSNGGVTISGGEPTLQYDFLLALVKRIAESNINICIQTNLNALWDKYEHLIPFVDYFMCDFKLLNPIEHRHWTGQDNANILKNIKLMDQQGIAYCLRTPVIPGINDDEKILKEMSDFAHTLKHIRKYELIPFHPFASYKYENLGIKYEFKDVNQMSHTQFELLKQKYEF